MLGYHQPGVHQIRGGTPPASPRRRPQLLACALIDSGRIEERHRRIGSAGNAVYVCHSSSWEGQSSWPLLPDAILPLGGVRNPPGSRRRTPRTPRVPGGKPSPRRVQCRESNPWPDHAASIGSTQASALPDSATARTAFSLGPRPPASYRKAHFVLPMASSPREHGFESIGSTSTVTRTRR